MKLSNSSLFSIVVSSFSWTAATAAPRMSDCPVRGDPDYGVAPCFAAPGWCTPPPEFKDYPVMDLSSRNSPLRDLGTWHPADDEDGPYYLTLEPGVSRLRELLLYCAVLCWPSLRPLLSVSTATSFQTNKDQNHGFLTHTEYLHFSLISHSIDDRRLSIVSFYPRGV